MKLDSRFRGNDNGREIRALMVHLSAHALIEIPAKARIRYAAAHAMRKCRAISIDHTLEKDRVVVEPSLAWRLASRFSLSRESERPHSAPLREAVFS
jgi:hypothetical protein